MPHRIAFLQHSDTDVPGVLGVFAAAFGLDVSAHRADLGESGVPDEDSFDLLVVLGSSESTTDDTVHWIGPERLLVGRAVDRGVPVLGVCFGAQLLAQVLGGTVTKAPRAEIGWRLLDTADPDVVPAGPWLDWHEDAFTCPPGAEPLASTDVSLHAFVEGPHTGVQFHPEVTAAVVEAWIGDDREHAGLTDADIDALHAGFDRRGRGPDGQSRALFEGWLARAGVRG